MEGEKYPQETKDYLIRCMRSNRVKIKHKIVLIPTNEIPPDRSILDRSVSKPPRTQSAQPFSLSCGCPYP